jgi:porin
LRFHSHLYGILLATSLFGTQAAGQDAGALRVLESLNFLADDWSLTDDWSLADDWADQSLLDPVLRPGGGISMEPVYYGEVFTNTRGGISTSGATRYQALLDLPLTLDFEKMQSPLPGRFFLLAQNTHGRGLTDDFVGDTQVVSNIDSFNNIMRVSEYWWEVGLFDDQLVVRLGKQDLNTEFLVMNSAGDFIQSSFGLSPNAGFPSYPSPSMAAVMLAQLTPSLELKLGIWDALAEGGGWGFSDNDVSLTVAQLEYEYALARGQLPGEVAIAIGHASAGDVFGQAVPSENGYYIQLEQLVFRENRCDELNPQGLGLFVSYLRRSSSGENPFPVVEDSVVGGMVYTGLIPGRDKGVVGAGFAWARLDQGGTNQETAVEVFYKAKITPSMSIQPDLQYIATPSGIHPDALVFGIRFQRNF